MLVSISRDDRQVETSTERKEENSREEIQSGDLGATNEIPTAETDLKLFICSGIKFQIHWYYISYT